MDARVVMLRSLAQWPMRDATAQTLERLAVAVRLDAPSHVVRTSLRGELVAAIT